MKKIPLLGAFISAGLATFCCLPAFLFLFLGISSTWLTFMTKLDFLRIPMSILSVGFFILALVRFQRKISCAIDKEQKIKYIFFVFLLFLLLVFLLFYPEILAFFMEDL